MLYAGLDLSRKRLDFHLLDGEGETVDAGASPPDVDGLRGLTQRLECHGAPIRAAIESMNGARFVHDRLELAGWQVEIADAQKVKGLAPLACKTDRIDAWVLAELSRWALVEAATHACTHPVYRERYQQTKARIGKQRGAKVAQVDLARRLAEAIWHMLSRNQPFAPAGATDPLAA
jgi:Transposase